MASGTSHDADWPMDKFRKAYTKYTQSDGSSRAAVLLGVGAFSPLHVGHLQMMHQANQRLSRAGFTVLSGWLSADPDQRVKKSHLLGYAFRVRAMQLATASDELLSVSEWKQVPGKIRKEREVLASLAQAILQETGLRSLPEAGIRIFCVSGGDASKRWNKLNPQDMHGLVMVPQDGEEFLLEAPLKQIFLAEACSAKAVSSEKVWQATKGGDLAFVSMATPEESARLTLAPTQEELAEFPVELDKLLPRVPPNSPWPAEKVMAQKEAFDQDNKILALLILSASLAPSHKGHLDMLNKARKRLEQRGFHVIGQWLSPGNEWQMADEALRLSSVELSVPFRTRVAELTASSDDLTMCSTWESQLKGKASAKDIAIACRKSLVDQFPLSLADQRFAVFHVCGSDRMKKYALLEANAHRDRVGFVIVPQSAEECLLEKPNSLIYVTEPAEVSAMHSDGVRKAIAEGNISKATEAMASAAARFVLAPTGAEREEMKEDFDKLGVKALGQAEIDSAKGKLKGVLTQKLGPEAALTVQDLEKLLKILDPDLSEEKLGSLMRASAKQPDGKTVAGHEFLDWIFTSWQ
eukprot:TRINITY_DN996_c0_g1_i3.p1 TRINITY_DN996_c0_g1~~TRINITY_DN996_c0_g1_i3.p1  ORF type:complete len:580 (-),score=129.64 TRINITY_DN996_c0_g1_i3:45-1784(-)